MMPAGPLGSRDARKSFRGPSLGVAGSVVIGRCGEFLGQPSLPSGDRQLNCCG